MIYADDIIEKSALILRNNNINDYNTAKDVWTPALTGYGFYNATYESPLVKDHIYYQKFTYKYTTTNQSPTWCAFYKQGGMVGGPGVPSNPVANTEYTASGVGYPEVKQTPILGQIYNGPGNSINGVSSYVKNVLMYDVTYLYTLLKAYHIVTTTDSLKTWCDNNLDFVPRYTNYDISTIVEDAIHNVTIDKGIILSDEFIEADGMIAFSANSKSKTNPYFDNDSAFWIYNNKGNGKVTHTLVDAHTDSPFYPEHKKMCKIETNGEASPNAGGFWCSHNSKAGGKFIERFVAKVPVGYTINAAWNPQGDSPDIKWITPNTGTGKWEEYAILYKCGTTGSFSNGGHIYLSGKNTKKNLIPWEIDEDYWQFSDHQSKTSSKIQNNIYHVQCNTASTADTAFQLTTKNNITLSANTTYYISFDVRSNNLTTIGNSKTGWFTTLYDGTTYCNMSTNPSFVADGEWHRIYSTITTGSSTSYQVRIASDNNWIGLDKYIEIKNVMLSTNSDITYTAYDGNDRVTWYVAYCNNCDITDKEYLKNYSILPNKEKISEDVVFSRKFDCRNLLVNGDGAIQSSTFLPNNWTYDTEDVAGCAKASFVQPVGVGGGVFGRDLKFSINPNQRYKVSYWIKCKRDMTSFLTAVTYYAQNGTELWHTNVMYVNGTKTTLTAELKTGDTTVSVANASYWKTRSYSRLGFRTSSYSSSYNDKGTSNSYTTDSTGLVSSVSGNVITLKSAYTGSNMPVGTVVVESYDGGTWPYPIQKGSLPTDNTWKYVEGYFGRANSPYDGNDSSSSWTGIPYDTTKAILRFNIYSNTGTVPIKYADIKIEPVIGSISTRNENKIQLGK